MDDFAAAAMLRVIALGLRRQGIALPARPPERPRGAHVKLADKRALLEHLHSRHGAQVLLRIGEGIREAREEPALTALLLARDPPDLIERWQRLERFVHSRHRIVVEDTGIGSLDLRHVSRVPDQAPTMAEDLLVIGLLVALAEQLGTAALQAHAVTDPAWAYRHGAWPDQPPGVLADASRWRLRWCAGSRQAIDRPATDADWTTAAYRLLAADPARRWTLDALAAQLGTSARSLQRRLQADGSRFSSLWIEARLARSAELLADSRQTPAEVGYGCGFADQAHFTRLFRQHTALTPVKYREQFARGSAGAFYR